MLNLFLVTRMSISYIFIFSLNNSGTTIMSQYLAANLDNSYLPPFGNNEGQMAPKVKDIMRNKPWDSESSFDWKFIKTQWDELAILNGNSVFIEASPPNIMRVKSILDTFKNSKYIFSISSPYSYIASHLYNYTYRVSKPKIIQGIKRLKFNKQIEKITDLWIAKAKVQKKNIEIFGSSAERTSYEEFCSEPQKLLKKLDINPRESNHLISLSGKKNSQVNEIMDMLPKHLAFLGLGGIQTVNSILVKYQELIEFFGYKTLSIKDVNTILSENILLALEGQDRKKKY